MVDFVEKLSSSQWKERKEALDRIDVRFRNSACTPTEASGLISAVIKVMSTDKHPQIVVAAANMVARIASTMKRDFTPLSKEVLNACLAGFRTNRPVVVAALRSAADASIGAMSIDTMIDAVLTSLEEKSANPSSTEEAMGVLNRALQSYSNSSITSTAASRRAIFKRLLLPLVTNMEARTDGVRDAACNALATARRFLADDSAYARFTLDVVDDSKKSRIDHAYQRLTKIVKKVEKPSKSDLAPPVDPPEGEIPGPSEEKPAAKKEMLMAPLAIPAQSRKQKIGARGVSPSVFATEQHLSDDEIKNQLSKWSVPESVISSLSSSSWRERLDSVDRLYSAVSGASSLDSAAMTQSLIRLLLQAPGFKETNVLVKVRLLETLASLLENSRPLSLCESLFEELISCLVGTICTPKLISSCEACFRGLEQCCGLPVLGNALLRVAATTKLPKSVEYTVRWLSRALERAVTFCLNYPHTIKCIKEGFNSSTGPVRHAYITLAGSVFACLSRDDSGGCPPAGAFEADLENSSKPAIVNLLREEFKKRECMVSIAYETPLLDHESVPISSHREHKTPITKFSPSEALRYSMSRELRTSPPMGRFGGNSPEDDHSPFGLSTTFNAVSVPILISDFKAKKVRLAQLAAGVFHPTRQRLETDFVDAGMHENLRRLLTSWDSNPVKTKEALVLLTHLLLHPTPSREKTLSGQHDLLSDTLANIDLLFQWMAESCFSADTLDAEVVTQGVLETQIDLLNAIDYLDELISRLADARMTLLPIEARILLPWPLLAPHLLDQYFCQSTEHCNRLANLLFSLCRVLSIDEVYTTVMQAVSTITETLILKELFLLLKRLFLRFPSLPNPSVADIKAIAQHVGSSDKQVNHAALECLKLARGTYTMEQISVMAGNLTDKDRAFLEDALNQDVSAQTLQTPMRSKTPYLDSASCTNNQSILASVNRSQMIMKQSYRDEDAESLLKSSRKWIMDVLEADDRSKESQMVSFLISKLLSSPPPLASLSPITSRSQSPSKASAEGSGFLDAALLALSHLDFLHHSTATRDLLLPEASKLIKTLGLQMDLIASGVVPAYDYSSEEACRFVRATIGLIVSFFRADFLTRDLTINSLSYLLAGLLHLHSTFIRIHMCQFESLVLKTSLLLLLVNLEVAQSLEKDLFHTLSLIHEKLAATNITAYILALTNLISPEWQDKAELWSTADRTWLIQNNLLLHLFDLATKKLAKNKVRRCSHTTCLNPIFISFYVNEDDQHSAIPKVVSCMEESLPHLTQQAACQASAMMIAVALNRLRM
ncbi:hypothetical protein Aperf_G00000023021 [Anoplocephala perfoliata]